MLHMQGRIIRDSMQRRRLQTRNAGNCRIPCYSLRRCKSNWRNSPVL